MKIRRGLAAAGSVLLMICCMTLTLTANAGNEVRVGALDIQIRKMAEWTDETNGDGSIRLQYASNSGAVYGTEDMDVILIQDKSGSMDSDFGYHIYMKYHGRNEETVQKVYQPIRNNRKYSESAEELMGQEDYRKKLNYDSEGNDMRIGEYGFNAPCQLNGHYYFLVGDDDKSGKQAGFFVPGLQLYNIDQTDLHHYTWIASREEALAYLEQGRRVVRTAKYYDQSGAAVLLEAETQYFLDVSSVCTVEGENKKILKTVDDACEANDRLRKSQEFMERVADMIYEKNPENRIAYIPFWCDVPVSSNGTGVWKNYSAQSDDAASAIIESQKGNVPMSQMAGSYMLGFCGKDEQNVLQAQITHPFTYNGTNWTAAFSKALELVEAKKQEGSKRQTLIVFLTDGYPQGYQGRAQDVNNPGFNARAQIEQLKTYEDVTIYACGTGINEADTTGLIGRLNSMDSTGTAVYARTTYEFDALYAAIAGRVDQQYQILIQANELIYHDVLAEAFEPDETKIKETIPDFLAVDSCSEEEVCGVPSDVYTLLTSGNSVLYVRNTKTLYWYIGQAEDGDYDAEGHEITIPVRFSHYTEPTGSEDVFYPSNDGQKATYYSTAAPDELKTVTMEAPVLLFSRKYEKGITIHTALKYAPSQNKEKRYLIFDEEKKMGDALAGPVANLTAAFPAGQKEITVESEPLAPGTYYIYEVNENGEWEEASERVVTIESTAQIETVEKTERIPASRVTSDEASLENYNNRLEILTGAAEVSYLDETMPTGDITVVKTIDSDAEEIWWPHGNPTFLIELETTGPDGTEYRYSHLYEFTREYVECFENGGLVSISYTFENVPIGETCEIREIAGSRYRLTDISANFNNVTVSSEKREGLQDLYAVADLRLYPKDTMVEFYNKKTNYQWDNHVTSVSNRISW